jgi:hypothetical protein
MRMRRMNFREIGRRLAQAEVPVELFKKPSIRPDNRTYRSNFLVPFLIVESLFKTKL